MWTRLELTIRGSGTALFLLCALRATSAIGADIERFTAAALKAPECVTSLDQRVFVESETLGGGSTVPALDHFYVVMRNQIDASTLGGPTTSFGHLREDYADASLRGAAVTGMEVPSPAGLWQRASSASASPDNSSAVQLHCYDVGSFINTWSFPYRMVPGSGAHTVYAFDFSIDGPRKIFDSNPSTDVVVQAQIEVPWLALWPSPRTGNVPVGQLSLFGYVHDQKNRKVFAVLFLIFDNRLDAEASYSSSIAHDLRTPFVSTAINGTSPYLVSSPHSARASAVPWNGLRFFRAHIRQDGFRRMIEDLNAFCAANRDAAFCEPVDGSDAFSRDVLDYAIGSFGLLHEVFHDADSNISMGVHYFDVGLWRFR